MDFQDYELTFGQGDSEIRLPLRRIKGWGPEDPAVLLLHGGNTRSDIYLEPNGGIAGDLRSRGCDVWLLDWRASPAVLGKIIDDTGRPPIGGSVLEECAAFTLDRVIDEDITAAVKKVRDTIGPARELSIVAWCLSSGAVSMAIARGNLRDYRVSNVVLMTLGLFYSVKWNCWIKAEDFIFERVLHDDPKARGVSPNPPPGRPKAPPQWTADMSSAFAKWPTAWLPGNGADPDSVLPRLTFMVGQPYSAPRLSGALRDRDLSFYFGYLHVGFYLHVSQMVRRGYAAAFDAPEDGTGAARSDLAHPEHFSGMRVTLIAAGQDGVWHRDAVDRMYEWLRAHLPASEVTKAVFLEDNIVELLWGPNAKHVQRCVAKAVHAPDPPRPSPLVTGVS